MSRLGWHPRRGRARRPCDAWVGDVPGEPRPRAADERVTLLRTAGHDRLPEIWCRCDGGPHGSFRIAAPVRAEALSVQVRYGGVDILSDPGTYCYHGDPWWRGFFRYAHARKSEFVDAGDMANWAGEHDGYLSPDSPARHRRSVQLDRASRILDIVDQIEGGSPDICPAFYLGPEIQVELDESCAFLSWPGSATPGAARLELPLGLSWSLHRAEIDALLGWHVPGPGRRIAVTIIGRGRCVAGAPLATRLEFTDAETLPKASIFQAVSWSASGTCRGEQRQTRAEAG